MLDAGQQLAARLEDPEDAVLELDAAACLVELADGDDVRCDRGM